MEETTRAGLGVLLSALLTCLALNLAVDRAGLKYVQGVIWPTDVPAFVQLPEEPIDVAVLGSSRASFGLPPSALDACLSEVLDRPTRSVNLGRTFATAYEAEVLYRELLGGARTPAVLVLAAGPEFFDEYNHRRAAGIAAHAELSDLPENLAYAHGLADVYAALWPLGRGAASAAPYLGGRYDIEARLTWLMLHHDGGQFCYGSPECRRQNREYQQLLSGRWDAVVNRTLPTLAEDRFTPYALGSGLVHRRLLSLLSLAGDRGSEVLLLLLPAHERYTEQVPNAALAAFRDYVTMLEDRYDVTVFDGSSRQLREQRRLYVDPDHLNAEGARRLSEAVCRGALAPLLGAGAP